MQVGDDSYVVFRMDRGGGPGQVTESAQAAARKAVGFAFDQMKADITDLNLRPRLSSILFISSSINYIQRPSPSCGRCSYSCGRTRKSDV